MISSDAFNKPQLNGLSISYDTIFSQLKGGNFFEIGTGESLEVNAYDCACINLESKSNWLLIFA